MMTSFFIRIGHASRNLIESMGGIGRLTGQTIKRIVTRPFEFRLTIYQIEALGVRSMAIALLTALSIGMVMALQLAFGFSRFGAKLYVGQVVALALVRELGPVMTALMVGGRISAGMAAELGSMKVTEQIDAIKALGADPIRKLVAPRVLATLFILPLLVIMADVVGIFGALIIAKVETHVSTMYFLNSIMETIHLSDFLSGVGKAFFFAFFISIAGCYQGFNTSGGTEGVGRATTRAVVLASVLILVSDFFLTKLFLVLE